MSPIFKSYAEDSLESRMPSVVVVDPRFDQYKELAASARAGKLSLHFRSSGSEALKLSRRLNVDAWLIAKDLDDMAGGDLLELLQGEADHLAVAMVGKPVAPLDAAATMALSHPITLADLERLLDMPTEERSTVFSKDSGYTKAYVTLPVGVGAAFVAIAVLMLG